MKFDKLYESILEEKRKFKTGDEVKIILPQNELDTPKEFGGQKYPFQSGDTVVIGKFIGYVGNDEEYEILSKDKKTKAMITSDGLEKLLNEKKFNILDAKRYTWTFDEWASKNGEGEKVAIFVPNAQPGDDFDGVVAGFAVEDGSPYFFMQGGFNEVHKDATTLDDARRIFFQRTGTKPAKHELIDNT
jgi:hypothetical protein